MMFYNLEALHDVGLGASTFETVGKVERVEPPHCEDCGWRLGPLRRLPPYKYKMTTKHVADLVSDGGVFAFSPRFRELFTAAGLKGLEFSESPVNLRNSSAVIYMAQPAYTYTLIDTEASGAVVRKFVGCPKCGCAAYNKIERIVIRDDSWTGEDVFRLSSLQGFLLVTQRFVDFVNANQFSGFSFKHQDECHFDYTSVFESRDPPDRNRLMGRLKGTRVAVLTKVLPMIAKMLPALVMIVVQAILMSTTSIGLFRAALIAVVAGLATHFLGGMLRRN